MKLRGDRVPGRSGTLCQRTKKKKLQNGQIREYPLVRVERDPHNVLHWFWHLSYKQKEPDGKYKSHTVSVRPEQVAAVQVLIAGNAQLDVVLSYLRSSK
jgi:hypothetical protein